MEPERRQALLEARSAEQRLRDLDDLLDREIVLLEQAARPVPGGPPHAPRERELTEAVRDARGPRNMPPEPPAVRGRAGARVGGPGGVGGDATGAMGERRDASGGTGSKDYC